MIIFEEGQNTSPATCSRNAQLEDPYYVWSMTHKLSSQNWTFIPYRIEPTVSYKPGYDLFSIKIDENTPEVLTGSTTTGQTNVHLIEGEYYITIYESTGVTLNINQTYDIVYQTIGQVNMSGQTGPVQYTGTTDVFTVYEG
jgi:hypothetical protein